MTNEIVRHEIVRHEIR